MNSLEYILDFTANLGCRMLMVGANLERVNDTMYRICHSYHLSSISIFSLNSIISVSAKSPEGLSGVRQMSVPGVNKHLEKLNRFNQLSRKVCSETPPPETLPALLEDAEKTNDYSRYTILLGYMIAVASLCALNDGSLKDILCADFNTVILLWLSDYLGKRNINNIVANTLCTWVAGTLAVLYILLGIGEHYFAIATVNCLLFVPGADMVNAFRNLLCRNEMNGILELLKVILETTAIVAGLLLSLYMFGGFIF